MIDKRLKEIELYNLLLSMGLNEEKRLDIIETQNINYLDLNEIKAEFKRDIKILNKESSSSFELIYRKSLDYITPIAFQGHIALYGDLKGNVINDLYNKNSKYIIENINICVFPLKDKTIILMFISKDNKKYCEFIKQFKKLKNIEKLHLISFIIFNYSEDFFISKTASKKILNNIMLEIVARNTSNILALNKEMTKEKK